MGQVTIYIDEQTEKKLQHLVEKSGISKSKWIAQLIQQKSATTWPAGIIELAGAWKELPVAEEIRKGIGKEWHRQIDIT